MCHSFGRYLISQIYSPSEISQIKYVAKLSGLTVPNWIQNQLQEYPICYRKKVNVWVHNTRSNGPNQIVGW